MQNLAFEIAQILQHCAMEKNRKMQNLQNIYKFGHFQGGLENVAEKWGNFGLAQKFCHNRCSSQNLQKDNMELAKR